MHAIIGVKMTAILRDAKADPECLVGGQGLGSTGGGYTEGARPLREKVEFFARNGVFLVNAQQYFFGNLGTICTSVPTPHSAELVPPVIYARARYVKLSAERLYYQRPNFARTLREGMTCHRQADSDNTPVSRLELLRHTCLYVLCRV